MATPPGDATGSINWQPAATTGSDDAARTTRSATFNADGREFTVTVSYSRAAVMTKYGISNEEVDATMEQVITRIGADQLKNLAGHSISTSLQNVDQLQYKSSSESSYHAFSPDLQRSNPTLFSTINTVRSVFSLNAETLRSVPSMSGESSRGLPPVDGDRERSAPVQDDSLLVDVEERGSPGSVRGSGATVEDDFDTPPVRSGTDRAESSVRFAEVSERGKTTGFVSSVPGFANLLQGTNPIKGKPQNIDKILYAHSFLANPEVRASQEQIDQSIAEITEALSDPELKLTKDQQNDVLKHLSNPYLADAVRVRLGLQGQQDVFLDFSQGEMRVEGQPEGVGQYACASICGEAILCMTISQLGIDNRHTLAQVLNTGIQRHAHHAEEMACSPDSSRVFDEVFPEIEKNYSQYAVGKGWNDHLERTDIVQDFASEVERMDRDNYIVVTAQQRSGLEDSVMGSILLYKINYESGDERWCVLDSHSSSEQGVSRGASIRSFDSPDKALDYVHRHYNFDENHRIDKVSLVENTA